MPLDPQAREFLQRLDAMGGPPIHELSPTELRATLASISGGTPEPVAAQTEHVATGPNGDIPLRVYTPAGHGPFPALIYFHGGGWVAGNLDSVETACTILANRASAVVISVDYRLAPEHPFPAPVLDCHAATRWVAEHAADLNIDAARIAVGGDSAGGNIAAVVAILARDHGGPNIAFQLLFYPATDHDAQTASCRDNGEGYYLTTELMRWFWNHYLGDGDGRDPRASPLRIEDATNLPPAFIITAEFDPLRDEGEAYADLLSAAGNAVTLHRYDGQIHGFVTRCFIMDAGITALEDAAAHLRAALEAPSLKQAER
ncbi:alpha/beta hydrolase [Salinisphaera aquimarina]|uniref:Alpha/beta hydrolase n=1 Tax=Salinisphaera aquimarina TaxID=2094031 RepID=A0ABV7ETE6_9GAMM